MKILLQYFCIHISTPAYIFLRVLVKYSSLPPSYISYISASIFPYIALYFLIFSSGSWLSIPPSLHLHIRHLRNPDYKLPPRAHQWTTANLPTLPNGTHVKILQNLSFWNPGPTNGPQNLFIWTFPKSCKAAIKNIFSCQQKLQYFGNVK